MFVVVGFGVYVIVFFYFFMYVFFKFFFFLGLGNVMYVMEDNLDIIKMGVLYKFMRIIVIFMIIGLVVLCGIYFFVGYFFKDKILEVVFGMYYYILWFVFLIGVIFIVFYSFRFIMLVFFVFK